MSIFYTCWTERHIPMELTLSILETTVWQNWETRRRQRAYCSSVWWSQVGILCFYCNSLMFITFSSAKVTGKIKSKWVNAFKNVKGQQGQQNNQAGAVKLSLIFYFLTSFKSNICPHSSGQPYDKSTRINKQNEQIKKHKELLVKQKEEINKQKELQLNQRKQKCLAFRLPLFVDFCIVLLMEVQADFSPFLSLVPLMLIPLFITSRSWRQGPS